MFVSAGDAKGPRGPEIFQCTPLLTDSNVPEVVLMRSAFERGREPQCQMAFHSCTGFCLPDVTTLAVSIIALSIGDEKESQTEESLPRLMWRLESSVCRVTAVERQFHAPPD